MVRVTRVPQRYRVLQLALTSPTGFTRQDAAVDVGCYELASRIGELEAEGVEFERITHTDYNRYNDPVRVMVYRLRYCPPVLAAHLSTGGQHE